MVEKYLAMSKLGQEMGMGKMRVMMDGRPRRKK